MRYLIWFSFFLVLSLQCFAQRNFKAGYVITTSGDTINGFIDYKEWNKNPKTILFKAGNETTAGQLDTRSVTEFSVDGFEHYKRYIGKISMGLVELSNLSVGIDSSSVIDTVFLKLVSSGDKLTLYQYTDNRKSRFFISDAGALPVELERYVFLDIDAPGREVEINRYRQQLTKIVVKYRPNDVKLIESLQRLDYNASNIKKVLAQINSPESGNKKPTLNDDAKSMRFFVGVALNTTQLSFSSDQPISYGGARSIFQSGNKYYAVMPMILGGFDVYFNKNVRKLVFRTEAALVYNKHSTVFKQTIRTGVEPTPREDSFTFNQFAVGLNPQLLYNIFNAPKLKFYLACGAQISYARYSNTSNIVKVFYNAYQGEVVLENESRVTTVNLLMNATAKAGITLANRLNVFAGYASPVVFSERRDYRATLTSYNVGVNYIIGR